MLLDETTELFTWAPWNVLNEGSLALIGIIGFGVLFLILLIGLKHLYNAITGD